jgi:hypothetical protein
LRPLLIPSTVALIRVAAVPLVGGVWA